MDMARDLVERIKIGVLIGFLAVSTGCAGFGVGGYYGGEVGVVEPEPDMVIFGGDYYRGRDAHNYSNRGHASRGVAHPAGAGRRIR
jgi:hypothetical protein